MLGFLNLVWWLDRYDREPIWLVFLSFLWGGCGAIIFAVIGSIILHVPLTMIVGETAASTLSAVLIAPVVEEPMKALVLIPIAMSRHFDNATDGFVYGAATGLGFAMTENFLYFMGPALEGEVGGWIALVMTHTLYSGVMHAAASSLWGAVIGMSKFRGWGYKLLALFGGYLLAASMHLLWNGLLVLGEVSENPIFPMLDFVLFPLEFACIFAVFQWCLYQEHRNLSTELAEEAILGTLPKEHVAILASYVQRNRSNWLPNRVSQAAYVQAATTLAMRRKQVQLAQGEQKMTCEQEIQTLRQEIRSLLAGASV